MDNYFYFDTSIWVDHYLERGENGQVALKLILKIIDEHSIVVCSNYVEKELQDIGFSKEEINSLLRMVKPKNLKRVQVTKEQFEEAKRLSKQRGVPLGDAIHAVLARAHDAQLVSRDWDFERLKDVVKVKKPEDLI